MRAVHAQLALALAASLGAVLGACGGDDSSTLGSGAITGAKGATNPDGPGSTNPSPTGVVQDGGAAPAPASSADKTPPPGVASNDAKAYFVATVYPSLMLTCGGCHNTPGVGGAPGYLSSTSASDAYASIEARGYIVPGSILLKKGQHTGPALTTDQAGLVQTWLDKEAAVRGTAAPVNLMAKLGTCLNQTLFESIGLEDLRTIKRDNENGDNCTGCDNAPCMSCHADGEAGMHANFGNLGTTTFVALSQNGVSSEGEYFISKYISTNGTTLVPSTALKDKATATAAAPRYSHPMFQLTPDMAAAITAFANDAITKYNSKLCGQ